MDKLDEVLSLLKEATPMLKEFMQWKLEDAEREKQAQQAESESEKAFNEWLTERKAQQAQQERDSTELAKHFYGADAWKEKDRFTPSYY